VRPQSEADVAKALDELVAATASRPAP
jgi:hypothetical protein